MGADISPGRILPNNCVSCHIYGKRSKKGRMKKLDVIYNCHYNTFYQMMLGQKADKFHIYYI